jgi:ArsC family
MTSSLRAASSPRVKSKEVVPEALDGAAALALMLDDPLLIRRLLMESGGRREAGFEPERVHAWLGLTGTPVPVTDACVREAARRASEAVPVCKTR